MGIILIQNGTLVTPQGIAQEDILVEGETIAAVGKDLSAPHSARIVNAEGLLIFPGLIPLWTPPILLSSFSWMKCPD